MTSQSKTTLFHEFEGDGFYLAQMKTPELAIFSYYLESEGQALLIDPTFDSHIYEEIAGKRKSKLISILLTHYHADFIAGHTQFDLPIIMGPGAKRQNSPLKIYEMKDGYTFNLGNVWIKILHTPGHTPESSCFRLISNKKQEVCLFTGDTLFLGEVGRPDLAASSNITSEDLAKLLFASLKKIRAQVNPKARIYPTHGAGSSCGKSISDGNFCSLEKQLENNYAFQINDEEQFINKILNEMPKAPSYFFHDAKVNQSGNFSHYKEAHSTAKKPLTAEQFKKGIDEGCVVIDSRHDFEGKTVKNSLLMSQNGTLASWVGAIVSPDAQLLLIANPESVSDLIERLLRIGFFKIRGYNNFTLNEWKEKGYDIWEPKSMSSKQTAENMNRTHLDVRNLSEWKAGVIENSKLISLGDLEARVKQLQGMQNIYVSCRSGLRARVAASILAKKSIDSIIIADKFQNFAQSGLKIVEYKQ